MLKTQKHTHPIDKEFATVVLENQMNCKNEEYRLKKFALPDQDDYPADYAFTANIQKYVNRLARIRLGLYKLAMRDIESFTTACVPSTNYMRIIQDTNRYFYKKDYSNESLMEYLTDLCTYTRCAYMKGLKTNYWSIRNMTKLFLLLRNDHGFTDRSYSELDQWLSDRVREIESETGPLSLTPVELSLEWVNCPIPYNFCIYKSVIRNSDLEKLTAPAEIGGISIYQAGSSRNISENTMVIADTSENISGNRETSGDLVQYDNSDTLSSHSDTSDNYSGNHSTTEDENSEVSERAPKKLKMADTEQKT